MKKSNPVLQGFRPDPSILRVKDDYYLATSTFEWFPGVCIHHSRDLLNWEIITYALTDEKYLDLEGIDPSCGIWAPNLTCHNGVYYLLYTIVYTNRSRFKDTINYLVTAENILGPWSKPVVLNKSGFDPSLFHDPEGSIWLVNMVLDYRLSHKRFAGICIQQFDLEKKKLIGDIFHIFKGSDAGTTEGPNIYYHNGYYYLTCAEGGTSFEHRVTMCRSKNLKGPYELSPYNPVITSFDDDSLLLKRAGHGQLVETRDGNWYMAYLCARTVDGYSVLGRETAIQKMIYTNDQWFCAEHGHRPEEYLEIPGAEVIEDGNEYLNFKSDDISLSYMTLRSCRKKNGIFTDGKGLHIKGGNSLSSKYNVSLLARRVTDFNLSYTVTMRFKPKDYRHMAGVACYYNCDNYDFLYLTTDDSMNYVLQLMEVENGEIRQGEDVAIKNEETLQLQIRFTEKNIFFYYREGNGQYNAVGKVLDRRLLSDEAVVGNGFTGEMVGMACQDLKGDGCESLFDDASYIIARG